MTEPIILIKELKVYEYMNSSEILIHFLMTFVTHPFLCVEKNQKKIDF